MNGWTLILMGLVVFGGWLTHRLWTTPLIGETDGPLLVRDDAYSYSMPVKIINGGLRTPRGVELTPLTAGWTLDDTMTTLAEIDAL